MGQRLAKRSITKGRSFFYPHYSTFPLVPERPLALSCPYCFFLIVFVCLVGFAVAVLLAHTQRPAPQNVWQESTLHSGSETSAANLVLSPEIIMCRLGAWKSLGGHKGKSLFAHQ